jgi:hypothetical protein
LCHEEAIVFKGNHNVVWHVSNVLLLCFQVVCCSFNSCILWVQHTLSNVIFDVFYTHLHEEY